MAWKWGSETDSSSANTCPTADAIKEEGSTRAMPAMMSRHTSLVDRVACGACSDVSSRSDNRVTAAAVAASDTAIDDRLPPFASTAAAAASAAAAVAAAPAADEAAIIGTEVGNNSTRVFTRYVVRVTLGPETLQASRRYNE